MNAPAKPIAPVSSGQKADADPGQTQAYENSLPGTSGNDTAGQKPVDDVNVSRTMMQIAQTDAERGSPGLSADEMRAMKR